MKRRALSVKEQPGLSKSAASHRAHLKRMAPQKLTRQDVLLEWPAELELPAASAAPMSR